MPRRSKTDLEDEAVWVSCPACDALPGDRCVRVETIDQLVHRERIDMMKTLEKNP